MDPDPSDFDAVLRACQGPLRSYVASMGVPMHAVDDVTQDVFLAYHRKPEARPVEVEPLRWLKGIARHQALDWFRNAGHGSRAALLDLVAAHVTAEEDPAEDLRLEALRRCLEGVTGSGRELLDAHYQGNEPAESIARRRGVGAAAVRMALLRLREQLRLCVERRLVKDQP